jgi:hypothetical protein
VAVDAHWRTTQEGKAGARTRLVRRGSMAQHGDATGSSVSAGTEASRSSGEALMKIIRRTIIWCVIVAGLAVFTVHARDKCCSSH